MKTLIRSLLVALILIVAPGLHANGVVAMQSSTPASTPETESVNRMVDVYPVETGPGTYVTITVEPGQSQEFTIVVGNAGNVIQQIRAYRVPAVTANNGGFSAAPYGTEPDAPTSWLDITELSMELEPGTGQEVVVTASVPAGTPPGEYVTAIAGEQADAFEIPGTDKMTQRVRSPMPVLIIVPGELTAEFFVKGAELEQRDGFMVGMIHIENTGNAIVKPAGNVRLLDAEGAVIGVVETEFGSIYLDQQTIGYVSWQAVPPGDVFGIEVEFHDPESGFSYATTFETVEVRAQGDVEASAEPQQALRFTSATLTPADDANPPSTLTFSGEIANPDEALADARVTIVTYKDGQEVDRYPIMQAVTLESGSTPVDARYSLPGGFTEGTYTFEVTIELGSGDSQTILVTQPLETEITVP